MPYPRNSSVFGWAARDFLSPQILDNSVYNCAAVGRPAKIREADRRLQIESLQGFTGRERGDCQLIRYGVQRSLLFLVEVCDQLAVGRDRGRTNLFVEQLLGIAPSDRHLPQRELAANL